MIGIYIRVSSEEQAKEGYSLESQKSRLMRYCEVNDINTYKIYVEEGRSAKNAKRPIYQDMLKDIKEGKIKGVLVNRLDRIMRSLGDLHNLLTILDEHNCTFASATESFDTSTATGRFFVYVVGALAQWENDLKSERIIEVLEDKVANEGMWIGNVPYPFNINENHKLVADPLRSKLTLDMIDRYLSGQSCNSIAEHMNTVETSDKIWRTETVRRIFKNPALYGATSWKDKVYENTHEGIITKHTFDKIQKILKDRSKRANKEVKNVYLFQGKIKCYKCDRIMSVQRYFRSRKNGDVIRGATYRCNFCIEKKNGIVSPSEVRVLNALYEYMETVELEPVEEEPVKDKSIYEKQLTALEEKRKKYQRAWASDLMTDDEFKSLMNETKHAHDEISKKINVKESPQVSKKDAMRIIRDFNKNFKALTVEEKQNFVSRFIRRIELDITRDTNKIRSFDIRVKNILFY